MHVQHRNGGCSGERKADRFPGGLLASQCSWADELRIHEDTLTHNHEVEIHRGRCPTALSDLRFYPLISYMCAHLHIQIHTDTYQCTKHTCNKPFKNKIKRLVDSSLRYYKTESGLVIKLARISIKFKCLKLTITTQLLFKTCRETDFLDDLLTMLPSLVKLPPNV